LDTNKISKERLTNPQMKSTKLQAKKKNGKVLGPVSNLEQHLQSDWWRRIFNSMYLKTDADVVEDKIITQSEVSLFTDILKPDKTSRILDLACGQGRHSIEMARRGFLNVSGLDRSHYLIQRAKGIAVTENLPINFKEGDARKLPYPTDTYDCIMILGNSFGYFESIDDDEKILKEVFRTLKPGGKFLIDVADGNYLKDNYTPRSWEWLDKKHFVCRERSLAKDNERLISREVVTHVNKGVIVDQFYAERLYTRESIIDLLQHAGFTDIHFAADITTDSQRNQDLGMMEKRLIVTASVDKAWTPVRPKSKEARNVVVVLGDPRKPDQIKPDTIFDADDQETVDNLKAALDAIPNYKFTYLDNHDTLYADLLKLKPKTDFVLNFCDEGFYNNARFESHIPALLDVLKIPYSGSGITSLTYCYDKSLIRGIAKEMDIPVARAFYIKPGENVFEVNISFPAIVKPNFGDGSFGITQKSVVYSIEQLNDAIIELRHQFSFENPILVEEFISGAELTIGIIGNPPESYTILPIVEEDFSLLPPDMPHICGYEAKWLTESPYFKLLRSKKAELSGELEKQIADYCLKLFERLGCNDYCRFDWRLDYHLNPVLLEVNPNPGWTWDGHLAKMAGIAGISYTKLLENIIGATEQRLSIQAMRNV